MYDIKMPLYEDVYKSKMHGEDPFDTQTKLLLAVLCKIVVKST